MSHVAVAFLWHQHQPYYPDDVGGENPMPWVRLHGVKSYYGMALHLLEFPEMHCTINLVPSLLVQLRAYTERGGSDRFLDISRRPADGLSEDDALFLLDHFFMANADTMIRPQSRYAELHRRRGKDKQSAREVLRRFSVRDLRDLQVWFNLAWIHPLAFEKDAELRQLRDKGRYFSEEEKHWVLEKHLEILRQVVPLHRQLAERGQVELSTTPFFHPILPLLFDKKLAREALPDIKLPRYSGGYPEDAEVHVHRAVELHGELFGTPPRGTWPAEGSVCQAMIPLLALHGIRWLATDEEILSNSTQGFISRDARGFVRNPDRMYRPYRVKEQEHELSIVFRDHALSDLIGFQYPRTEAAAAADDFLQHLQKIGEAVRGTGQTPLVTVILDGENCWEHYPDGGVPFLRALYERCCQSTEIKPVRIGDFLEHNPPRDALPHLFAGSWIHHNFAIWIGHEEDNTAWDHLHKAREHLLKRIAEFRLPIADSSAQSAIGNRQSAIQRAWEEIYIAEGSDWFWWYGDEHSSSQDALFDYLFRKHLQNVYLLLGDTPPAELARPISRRGQRAVHTLPRSFQDVKVDGRRTFLQWFGAGRYNCHNERATMAMSARGPIKDLYFGFDRRSLLIRVDFDRAARLVLADFELLRVGFAEPAGWELLVHRPSEARAQNLRLLRLGEPLAAAGIEFGVDQIVEMSIPLTILGLQVDRPISFFLELLQGNQSRERAPSEGTINLTCPSADFEQIMWDV